MSDLIERLRKKCPFTQPCSGKYGKCEYCEAADEIERMQPVIDAAREVMRWWDGEETGTFQAFEALGKALDEYDRGKEQCSK